MSTNKFVPQYLEKLCSVYMNVTAIKSILIVIGRDMFFIEIIKLWNHH